MAPVAGRPFLEYLFDYWIEAGVRRFVLSIGYLGDLIMKHFGDHYRGANIQYVVEESPLGTGGAIRKALMGDYWTGQNVLISNGDTWFEASLPQLLEGSNRRDALLVLSAKLVESNDRYGGIHADAQGFVTRFGVPAPDNQLINAGCYLANRRELVSALQSYPEVFSFEQIALVAFAQSGQIVASIQEGVFLDIGVPEDYERAASVLIRES
jgi:D-glycero-alpha-D-manno-heptose 1-phosphate guanylyltransferase